MMIKAHFDASNVSEAGGGAADEIVRASEIYADDAVLEWPQGGERVRGKANIIAVRSAYPARQEFEVHRSPAATTVGQRVHHPLRRAAVSVVGIMEFHDGKVVHERIYFGEPWEPPAWRALWVERIVA